jgi:hypothetical protein
VINNSSFDASVTNTFGTQLTRDSGIQTMEPADGLGWT